MLRKGEGGSLHTWGLCPAGLWPPRSLSTGRMQGSMVRSSLTLSPSPSLSSTSPSPRDPFSITSLGPGWGQRAILEGPLRSGREGNRTSGARAAGKADPPAQQVHQHLACLFSRAPYHGVQAGSLRGSRGKGSWGAQACPPLHGGRAIGEIWRGSELRAQHFPLSVFLLEEFFFP